MKTDLATAIVAAVIGTLAAFFITNQFFGAIDDVTFKTIDGSINTDLVEPDPEVFNYRALNPTVEVYVGDCDEYNEFGECVYVVEDPVIEETATEEVVTEDTITEENTTEQEPSEQENENGSPN